MLDTIKTSTAGLCASCLPHLEIIPDIASFFVAVATFIYLFIYLTIKIKKELKK